MGEITGVGLLFADGEEHKKQRRLLANPFSARNIQRLVPVFKEKSQDLVQIVKAKIDSTGEKSAVLERKSPPFPFQILRDDGRRMGIWVDKD